MSLRDYLQQNIKKDPLNKQVLEIETRDDFVSFVYALQNDVNTNGDSWENSDISSYLNGIAAWSDSGMDGFLGNMGMDAPPEPSWRVFGMILIAGRSYDH